MENSDLFYRNEPVGVVVELLTDDALIVSDSRGTRNLQEEDVVYLDDEIISGKVKVSFKLGDFKEEIFLSEDDLVVEQIPKEITDGLISDSLYFITDLSGDD